MDASLRLSVAPIDAFGDEWQRLWSRVPDASPFQAPSWLVPWAACYAPGRCWLAAVEHAGELVACLPLFWWQETVFLAGTGPSDRGDGLFLPGFEAWAGPLLREALASIDRPVERVDLQQLPRSSPLLDVEGPPGWRGEVVGGDPCTLLPLAGEDGMEFVGERLRSNWRRAMRVVAREGGCVERVETDEVADAIAALERLHALRWAERGEDGMLADPLLSRLLRDAAPVLSSAGLLRLHRLRLGDETIGVLIALHGDRHTCFYLSGFDPRFAKLSPGTVLVGATIAAAAREGDRAADFLRGREPYKARWRAEEVPTFRRVFVPA